MRMGIGLGVGINRSNYAQGIFSAYATRVVADGGVVEGGSCVDAVSGILLNASLLLIPSGYKGGKLYAEIPTNGNGDLTWTRGGDAFRTNASGLIQRVPWNLLRFSEEFSNAVWSQTNLSVTANSTTAPNGTTTADTIIPNSTNSYHPIVQTVAVVSGTQYAFSIYAKSAGYDFLLINTSVGSASGNVGPLFNLSTGTLIGSLGGNNYGATITSVGNGWYRIAFSYVTNSTSTAVDCNSLPTSTISTYSGNGTSGLYLWGAQLVEGTTAQTYLPTTDRLNFPRLSYMYGSCPSALLEPQRTNLALQSETFDNASWTKPFGWTVTANATTSPDGTSNADLITPTNFNNLSQSCVVTTSTNYAISIYVKRNTTNSTWVSLIFSGGTSISYGYVINWSTLSISLIPVRTAATNPTFESVGNGWYRISFVCASGNNTSASLQIIPDSQAGTNSIYLYGAQLEAGAYPTTYIPTTSATATRVADSFSRNNIYTNGLISASGGTWFVELRGNTAYTSDTNIGGIFLDDFSAGYNNGLMLRKFTTDRIRILKTTAGAQGVLYLTTTDTTKLAIKWNGTTCDVFANGTKVVSESPFTVTNMQFLGNSTIPLMAFIQQMALFPTPLTDAQCQTLTT